MGRPGPLRRSWRSRLAWAAIRLHAWGSLLREAIWGPERSSAVRTTSYFRDRSQDGPP